MRTILTRAGTLLLALALSALAPAAHAQTGAASITGLVTDQSSAAVPGVAVVAVNQATNVEYFGSSNEAGNYTITSLPVGTYVVKASLTSFKTASHEADRARDQADRAPRLQDGGRLARGHGRGRRPVAGAADAVGHRRRGHLGQHAAVAAAERPQPRPARAARAWHDDAAAAGLHRHRRRQPGASVRQRPPRAGEQLHARRPRRERDDRQPRLVPGQPRRARRDQRRDQQLLGRHRQRGRRRLQQRDQVGRQRVPRQRVRVLPQQRHGREQLGEQPLERGQGRAQAAHLRRHAGRADHQGQAVLLRRLPGLGARQPGHRAALGGAGGLARGRPLEPAARHGRARPAHRPAVPGQPDPARQDQPGGPCAARRHRQLPAAEPGGERRLEQLRGPDAHDLPRPPGRPAPRLERLGERQDLGTLHVRQVQRTRRPRTPTRRRSARSTISRSGTSGSTGATSSGPR